MTGPAGAVHKLEDDFHKGKIKAIGGWPISSIDPIASSTEKDTAAKAGAHGRQIIGFSKVESVLIGVMGLLLPSLWSSQSFLM